MKKLTAAVIVIAFAAGSLLDDAPLIAQTITSKTEQTANLQKNNSAPVNATQVAEDGYAAVRAMHAARVAIFNGESDVAKKVLADAKTLLEKTKTDELAAGMKGDLIPIDGSLALADTFVPSNEKAARIEKANEHFSSGNKDQALEQLRLGEIEVNFSRVMMPMSATEKRLEKAINFANEGKFYECNLALKAVEDGLQLDSVSLIDFSERDSGKASGEADPSSVKK